MSVIVSIYRRFRTLPGPVQCLYAVTAVLRGGSVFRPFLSTILVVAFAFSPEGASGVVAWYGAGFVTATLAGGYATDRLGVRRVLMLSFVGTAASMSCLFATQNPLAIFPIVFLVGFFTEIFRPPSTTMLSYYLSGNALTKAYSLHHITINAGASLAPMIGSLMISIGVTWLLSWNIVMAVICGLLVWRGIPSIVCHHTHEEVDPDSYISAPALFRREPGLLTVLLVNLSLGILMIQTIVTLPLFIRDPLGLPVWAYGVTLSWNAVGVMLLSYPITRAMTRWPASVGAGFGMLLSGLGMAGFGLSDGWWSILASMSVFTIGEVMVFPTLQQLVSAMTPARIRGTVFGWTQCAFAVGMMIGPLMASKLLAHMSFFNFWFVVGGLGLIGGLCLALSSDRAGGVEGRSRRSRC